jgi:abequosyltransferase
MPLALGLAYGDWNRVFLMADMKLSFCLPTFNRGALIGEALESILAQGNREIEVVIVDGGSTDTTQSVLAEFSNSSPLVKVYRQEVNSGIDIDLLTAVRMARGQYCWLMSDDDQLEPGALNTVLRLLEENEGIAGASVNYASYDKHLRFQIATVPAATGTSCSGDYLFKSREECFATLGMHLGYISAQVIDRKLWTLVSSKYDLRPYLHSAWAMVYVIGQMLTVNPRWLYVHTPCIRNRSANDSFVLRVGEYKRQLISHDSFPKIVEDLFGKDSRVFDAITKATIRTRMPRNLAKIKANNIPSGLQFDLIRLYTRKYWKHLPYWVYVFPIFLIPNWVLRLTRSAYFLWRSARRFK